MHLYIETMDATLVEFAPDGRVRLDNEDWARPSVQERRAIIHAAEEQIENLKELLQMLETEP
jgi:acyl-CoA reductase-like NAD-dependent aldehyde dehydrogenase